jgi:hypothetical protein
MAVGVLTIVLLTFILMIVVIWSLICSIETVLSLFISNHFCKNLILFTFVPLTFVPIPFFHEL